MKLFNMVIYIDQQRQTRVILRKKKKKPEKTHSMWIRIS